MTIFPPLMLLRVKGNERDPLRPLHAALCALGAVATIAGLVVSVLDLAGGSEDEEELMRERGGAAWSLVHRAW